MSLFNTFSLYLDPFGQININEDLIIIYEINIKQFVYITCIILTIKYVKYLICTNLFPVKIRSYYSMNTYTKRIN